MDIETNSYEWEVTKPVSDEQPTAQEESTFVWEALPFAVFAAISAVVITAAAVYRIYEFLSA